ncbi:hypothetical protein PGTUg99_001792 [Puccinia graminis f. sp. tritici]|uniref:Uncharacterized protein n=1 Tax=Puccinia graminis f. sp. tritici TaxID=56615 RepID=A0A5B0PGE6_PUCGR|nr:hypothetical protein PGTUg99_001792 [Puccinia graminis f. sp. tritici]
MMKTMIGNEGRKEESSEATTKAKQTRRVDLVYQFPPFVESSAGEPEKARRPSLHELKLVARLPTRASTEAVANSAA